MITSICVLIQSAYTECIPFYAVCRYTCWLCACLHLLWDVTGLGRARHGNAVGLESLFITGSEFTFTKALEGLSTPWYLASLTFKVLRLLRASPHLKAKPTLTDLEQPIYALL
jgi:hypothetical protein